ncbi:hypothetical protein [Streptomyces sp. NPDC003077]|uniref:hypothetical protein n=1 Tax=Streptomyces sp. NPDC003077 TaxID=3154443 RepID=UPI0033B87377
MSYPNQNNPYGPPSGPPQPGYGYPQQQPGQPYAPYPGGMPGGGMPGGGMPGGGMPFPMAMPGGVKAARVFLFVLTGLGLIGLIGCVVALNLVSKASATDFYSTSDALEMLRVGKGVLIGFIIFIVLYAAAAMVLALQFAKGGNGVRIAAIIFGALTIAISLFMITVGFIHLIFGILIIVFVAKADGAAWFNRPRY